jgi:hypothetical protein
VGVGLVLLVGALAAAVALLCGGRPGTSGYRFRGVRLVVAAAVLQLAGTLWSPAYAVLLALSALLAAVFVVANVRVPGVPLIALGLLLNAVVIGLNGAMPVSEAAAQRAGVATDALVGELRHTTSGDGTTLGALGDVIPVPLPWRAEVVSVGDVFVAAGVGLLVLTLVFGRPPVRGSRRPVRQDARRGTRSA